MDTCQPAVICMISCIGKVNYTRNYMLLKTLAHFEYRIVAIAPGSLARQDEHSLITHLVLPLPRNNFWYGAGVLNTLRAIVQRLGNMILLLWKVGQVRPHLIICSEPDAWLVAVLASWRYRCKVIVDLQEVYEDRALAFPQVVQCFARKTLRRLMHFLSVHTHEIIHVSKERQQAYDYLCRPGFILGAYPEIAQFSPHETRTNGSQPNLVKVVHAGALRSTYASEQFLDAMMIVASVAPQIRFLVLGGVTGKLKNAKTIDTLCEQGILEILEQIPFSHVVCKLQQSDIGVTLVLPVDTAHRLAAPQKLYEYLASGLPVLAADVPTLRRVVTENKCGILVDATSPQSIADGIVLLAQQQALRRWLGANSRRAAEDKFNWESQVCALCQAVQGALTSIGLGGTRPEAEDCKYCVKYENSGDRGEM